MSLDQDRFRELAAQVENLRPQLDEGIREVTVARQQYFGEDCSPEAKQRLEEAEKRAALLCAEYAKIIEQMQRAADLPDDLIELIEAERQAGDSEPRVARRALTQEEVEPTHDYEELPKALDAIYKKIDTNWLKNEKKKSWRLERSFLESPFSLVKGVRLESEYRPIHRFAQALLVSEDFLEGHQHYDFFAAALLVPQITILGTSLDLLKAVEGDVSGRLASLWKLPSANTDSAVFELLVGVACAQRGRKLEFLTAGSRRTPEMRVRDWVVPTVIECKRKRP